MQGKLHFDNEDDLLIIWNIGVHIIGLFNKWFQRNEMIQLLKMQKRENTFNNDTGSFN